MREAVKTRLQENLVDWEIANYKAAEFWTQNITSVSTIEDALIAFEAYYHYIAISQYALAGEVLVKRRRNQWESDEPLGNAFYRLGLLESIKTAINQVIDYMPDGESLSRIYNILGDVYWLMGEIRRAINSHEQSKKIAINFDLKGLEVVAFLNIGLCQIDIWEIQLSIENFKKCIQLTEDTVYRYYTIESYYCLSFLNSVLGFKEESISFANKVFAELDLSHSSAWSGGYRWLFLGRAYINLFELETSFEMYSHALVYAEDSHYPQVKANALNGFARIFRLQNDWEQALSYTQEAIDILKSIGARCDLAEAYFQLGLTYQAMGEHDQAEKYKEKALELFEQMKAPKQIERVNKAFEQGAIK
jgi:tetratricopeptide (TPR) repeat protein